MREWVHRLRSGAYRQGRGSLHVEIAGVHQYCSLGVAAEIAAERGIVASEQIAMPLQLDSDRTLQSIVHSYMGSIAQLRPRLRDYFGLTAQDQCRLMYLNDTANRSLCDIADFLEREYLGADSTTDATEGPHFNHSEGARPRLAQALR